MIVETKVAKHKVFYLPEQLYDKWQAAFLLYIPPLHRFKANDIKEENFLFRGIFFAKEKSK